MGDTPRKSSASKLSSGHGRSAEIKRRSGLSGIETRSGEGGSCSDGTSATYQPGFLRSRTSAWAATDRLRAAACADGVATIEVLRRRGGAVVFPEWVRSSNRTMSAGESRDS